MECVDLKARYGESYRVTSEECAESRFDPWGMEIVGKRGRVYPHGGDLLGVEVERRWAVTRELVRRGYALHQDGDSELTFLVPADDLDSLADLLHLPRVRRLSDDHKARCIERLREFQFRPRTSASTQRGRIDAEG